MIPRLRLWSGLVMLAYVTMHLVNHAMGLVSLGAMERVLGGVAGLWSLWPMQVLLYGSFLVHYALALQALWQRRTLHLRTGEIAQLVLGFAIPILLARHVVGTRVSDDFFGTRAGYYAYVLWVFFVRSPELGALQMLVLVIAWTHAMLGLHFWLRSKPAYARLHEGALVVAVLVPVLALLGMIAGGRSVAALAAEPGWTGETFAQMSLPTASQTRAAARSRRWPSSPAGPARPSPECRCRPRAPSARSTN
jgi:adenylate cyclase